MADASRQSESRESIVGPIIVTSIGSALLGAILALVVLAWLNDGELEYVTPGTALTAEQAADDGAADDEMDATDADTQALNDSVIRLQEQVVFIQATLEAISSDGTAPEDGAELTDDADTDGATATDDEAANEDDAEATTEAESDATDEGDVEDDDADIDATATDRRPTSTRTPRPTATEEPTATPTRRPAGPTPTLRIGP